MRHFLLRLLLFSIPLLLIFVSAEVVVRHIPNTKKLKRQLVEEKGHRTRVAIVGNSVAEDGIDPLVLGDSTYNYAISGQPLRFTLRFYQKYLDTLPDLRNIIFGGNFAILFYDAYQEAFTQNTKLYWEEELSGYRVYMDIYDDSNPLRYSELISCPTRMHKKFVQWMLGKPITHSDSLGLSVSAPYASCNCTQDELIATARSYAAHTQVADSATLLDILHENLGFLDTLAMSTSAKGIRLDLLLLPVAPDCLALYDSAIREVTFQTFEACAKKYPNVYFHNYMRDLRLPRTCFADANHLNCDTGAITFTRILRKDMGWE